MQIISSSPQETLKAGALFGRLLKAGDIICLKGDLGTGKTVFTRGISAGLGVKGCAVVSPTFVLMRCYKGRLALYHFDLYRINDPEDMASLGYEEFFFSDGVSVIEWAERLGFLAPAGCLTVELSHMPGQRRRLKFAGRGPRYRELLRDFETARVKAGTKNREKK